MAKAYVLSEADVRAMKDLFRWYRGGGTGKSQRPPPLRRPPRGGSQTASIAGSLAVAVADIDLSSWTKPFNGSNATEVYSWKVTPGIVGTSKTNLDVGEVPSEDGVLLVDWRRVGSQPSDYFDVDGNVSPYLEPPTELTAVFQRDSGGNAIPSWRAAVNISGTDIRASADMPVTCGGFLQELGIGDNTYELFVITNVMDFRALPGFIKGSVPGGTDDPNLQIPYHSGGAEDFELDSADCAG